MLYRTVPKNGDKLSILAFGAMRLAMKGSVINEARATEQLHHAIRRGVNFVDTAWPYHMGKSEPFLGRALSGGYREKIKLSTKLPSWLVHSHEEMDRYLDAQLQRLNTDHIDYYLLHSLNGNLWDQLLQLNVIDFLDRAKKSGRVINVGFSFHGNLNDFKRIIDGYPWELCLMQYNYLDEDHQAGTSGLKYAASKDLGVIVMEPLRGGNLGRPEPPPAVAALWREAETPRSPAEWALRWVWNHPEVTSVLSGMNEEAHIEENLAIADEGHPNSLTAGESQLIKRVAKTYRNIMKIGCTGCGYCLPCSAGVMIPDCFDIYNTRHMFGSEKEARVIYAARAGGILTGSRGYASQCVQCGECAAHCPQNLDIQKLLENVVKEFESGDTSNFEEIARKIFVPETPNL